MKQKPAREYLKVWRPQHFENLELMRGISSSYSTPRHFHPELEIAIVQNGSPWEFYYRGTKHAVPPGAFTLTQPGEAHWAHLEGEVTCIFGGVRIDPVLIQSVSAEIAEREMGMPFFPIPVVSDRSLNAPILKLHQVLEVETTSALEQQSLVLDTLAQLILQYTEEPPTLRAIGQERTYIQRVRDYIEDHYAENIFLEQLAQVANLSPFHLNRAFSKEFGLPPHAYQTQSRIARSRTLLLDGWSIAQVAHETGFSNQSHFGWHFKRIVGVPPGQYTRDSKHLANKQQELDIPRGLS